MFESGSFHRFRRPALQHHIVDGFRASLKSSNEKAHVLKGKIKSEQTSAENYTIISKIMVITRKKKQAKRTTMALRKRKLAAKYARPKKTVSKKKKKPPAKKKPVKKMIRARSLPVTRGSIQRVHKRASSYTRKVKKGKSAARVLKLAKLMRAKWKKTSQVNKQIAVKRKSVRNKNNKKKKKKQNKKKSKNSGKLKKKAAKRKLAKKIKKRKTNKKIKVGKKVKKIKPAQRLDRKGRKTIGYGNHSVTEVSPNDLGIDMTPSKRIRKKLLDIGDIASGDKTSSLVASSITSSVFPQQSLGPDSVKDPLSTRRRSKSKRIRFAQNKGD